MPDNMDYQLDHDLLELEAQLALLVPCAVPAELAASVSAELDHALVDATVDLTDAELKELEAHLELLSPTGLSTDVLMRMTEAMDRWHEHVPVEEKLVQFEQAEAVPAQVERTHAATKSGFNIYAAAAAVALLGAAAAIVMPKLNQNTNSGIASGHATSQPSSDIDSTTTPAVGATDVFSDTNDAWLVPDSLSHNVTHTSDAGVLMSRDNVPHRRIRIDYVDRVIVLDKDGREIEINRPGVQYMLIPVQTN